MGRKYRLTAEPRLKRGECGLRVTTLLFTATPTTTSRRQYVAKYDVPPEYDIDGLITSIVPGVAKGIRCTQALKRGEAVDLALYTAEELYDTGLGFIDLEP